MLSGLHFSVTKHRWSLTPGQCGSKTVGYGLFWLHTKIASPVSLQLSEHPKAFDFPGKKVPSQPCRLSITVSLTAVLGPSLYLIYPTFCVKYCADDMIINIISWKISEYWTITFNPVSSTELACTELLGETQCHILATRTLQDLKIL